MGAWTEGKGGGLHTILYHSHREGNVLGGGAEPEGGHEEVTWVLVSGCK